MEGNCTIDTLKSLQQFLQKHDNSESFSYMSNIPQQCKNFPCVLGIDEAGRGPVLGPMVYGTAFCPINSVEILETLECADSKALTEEKRDIIFSNILTESKKLGWGVEVISPNVICNCMLSRSKYSLNRVSVDSAVGLIKKAIDAGVNIARIFVDTVGKPETYQKYLESLFPNYNITVAKKADSTYPIVSAASICAKVTRDHALKVWTFPEGLDLNYEDFGSGYPGDPVTKKFLMSYCDPVFGFPQLVRFSWSTAATVLEEKAYHVEWENNDEEKAVPKDNTQITSFFKMTKPKIQHDRVRHPFFRDRCLKNASEF